MGHPIPSPGDALDSIRSAIYTCNKRRNRASLQRDSPYNFRPEMSTRSSDYRDPRASGTLDASRTLVGASEVEILV
jgi:hypothetical protein